MPRPAGRDVRDGGTETLIDSMRPLLGHADGVIECSGFAAVHASGCGTNRKWGHFQIEIIDLALAQLVRLCRRKLLCTLAWSTPSATCDWEKPRTMGLFRRKVPIHYVPVHPDNIAKKDWIILLEAGTIVGPSAEKLRVALATMEKKIVTKYNIFLRPEHFLVLDGYDPRIHALYYCPQLYKYDADKALVPLEGEEIGKLVAKAVQNGVVEKQPWYTPSEMLPRKPIVDGSMDINFDSVVVDAPIGRSSPETTP